MLDGGLKEVFGNAFGPIFLAGSLIKITRSHDDGGAITETEAAPIPVKCVPERITEAMRSADEYTQDDVAFIILQKGVTGPLLSGDKLIFEGVIYRIGAPITQDAAKATWTFRATPIEDAPDDGGDEVALFDSSEITFDDTDHTFDEAT